MQVSALHLTDFQQRTSSCTDMDHGGKSHDCKHAKADLGLSGCSIGGAPGVGVYNGPATNVTTLKTDFPSRGLNGTAVNVSCKQLSSI